MLCRPVRHHVLVGTRILTVEDDERIRAAVKLALEDEGWVMEEAETGEQALDLFTRNPADVVLIDIMLPGIDGFEVCRSLRRSSDVPIVMVTARADTHDVVAGLEAGADDYLTKPFRVEELIMRLRALVRRSTGHATPRIVCGAVSFDAQIGVFELDGLPLKLTALEWRVLECLILRKEAVVERGDLAEKVYQGDVGTDSNSLEVIVARLRRKIGEEPGKPQVIKTERGGGYIFVSPRAGR